MILGVFEGPLSCEPIGAMDMGLSAYDKQMLKELHAYNRIPLWLFNSQWELLNGYFDGAPPEATASLSIHAANLVSGIAVDGLEIISRGREQYYAFSFQRGKLTFNVVGGPLLLAEAECPENTRLSFSPSLDLELLACLETILPIGSHASLLPSARITVLLLKDGKGGLNEADERKESAELSSRGLYAQQDKMARTFTHELFDKRESAMHHTPYSREVAVLNCVREGDVALLESTYRAFPPTQYGTMSHHPQRQLLCGCIADTTLVTRYAIQGGLDEETAFTLSDVYIKRMEKCKTAEELGSLNEAMAVDFTEHVRRTKQRGECAYSTPIAACLDYIAAHLHGKITLEALASEANLAPKYLSSLFRKTTGQTLTSYIEEKRIDEAKRLLVYSKYTSSQIGHSLAFHSHSYFIAVFRRRTGMTPNKYRVLFNRSVYS